MARPSKKSEKSSSSSTRKATRAKKDPTKPKRALSAYVLFAQETRNQVKEENPEAGFGASLPPPVVWPRFAPRALPYRTEWCHVSCARR